MSSITKPIIRKILGGYNFIWSEGAEAVLTVLARHVHNNSHGVSAEISIEHFYSDPLLGSQSCPLIDLRVNLSTKRGRDDIVKRLNDLKIWQQLEKQYSNPNVQWDELIEQVAGAIINLERMGTPGTVITVEGDTVYEHPGYYIEPLITKGVPNILYGDKGVSKTTLALAAIGSIQNNLADNTLQLDVQAKGNTGLLDWENNEELTRYTISRLIRGGSIRPFSLNYMRCDSSLPDDLEHIGNWITGNKIDVILIDSLGQAAGSDRFDSSGKVAAIQFFKALRQLNVTSLIIAQNAKNEDSSHKTIFGSTFFTYYARSIFELCRDKDDTGDEMHIALIQREANFSAKHPPIGFLLTFSSTSITITPEPVTLSQFLEKVSQTNLLLEILKKGALPVSTIAKELQLSDNRTRVLLSRAKKRQLVTDLGSGRWGLLLQTN